MKSLNYNEGKLRPSLILGDMKGAFDELLKVREHGAVKYDRMNWAISIGTEDAKEFVDANFDSMMRHLLEAVEEDKDEESGCLHLAQLAIRAMMGIEYILGKKKSTHISVPSEFACNILGVKGMEWQEKLMDSWDDGSTETIKEVDGDEPEMAWEKKDDYIPHHQSVPQETPIAPVDLKEYGLVDTIKCAGGACGDV